MAGKIRALDENTIRKIAAGEVVERPASVAKELLENAVDAGARRIALEILEAGRALVRVSDDGEGMSGEDALLAVERHTTSKIASADDLSALGTFGFRGEALPSIAAVSRLKLITRRAQNPQAFSLDLEGGKLLSQQECGRAEGTTVEVRDLFFNTPARLKFLKSEGSEKGKLFNAFEEIALAHPAVGFQLKSENRVQAELPPRSAPLERLTDLWGESFHAENLLALSLNHPLIRIEGWVSHPNFHQAGKSYQIFFVNRRPIFSRTLTHALYEAYRDCLPVGRHPVAAIFLTVPPDQVDVNVHPSKREVRFRGEPQIYEALLKEIRLKRSRLAEPPAVFAGMGAPSPAVQDHSNATAPQGFSSAVFRQDELKRPAAAPAGERDARTPFGPAPRVLAQFHSLYIIAEQGDRLLIVDQHAAGERILYEKFRRALAEKKSVPSQPLLIPYLWNLSRAQFQVLESHREVLRKLGFLIEPFGEQTFRVREAPAEIPESGLKEILDGILSALENQAEPSLLIEEKIMHRACRAAVKANDSLSARELAALLEELSHCDNPHTCPHGRPITLALTREELDRKFGRT